TRRFELVDISVPATWLSCLPGNRTVQSAGFNSDDLLAAGFWCKRTTMARRLLVVVIIVVFLVACWLVLARNCPSAGIALTPRARALHRLKNRTALPQDSDFDSRITLDALLQP